MTIRAILPAADYLFMTRFSSTEQTRYYLQGVNVEPGPILAATDGHRLGVLRLEANQGYFEGESFILAANKALIRACKVGKREQAWLICRDDRVDVVTFNGAVNVDVATLREYTGEAVCSFPAKSLYIDGTFPDWKRILPSGISGNREQTRNGLVDYVGYNADLLADFAMPNSKAVSFDGNGSSAVIVANSDPRFIGVLMPMPNGLSSAAIIERMQTVAGTTPQPTVKVA